MAEPSADSVRGAAENRVGMESRRDSIADLVHTQRLNEKQGIQSNSPSLEWVYKKTSFQWHKNLLQIGDDKHWGRVRLK